MTGGGSKRVFDALAAALALVVLAPLLGWLAWRISRELGRPVLFRQWRSGRGGRRFRLLKFRSMTDARDPTGALLPDAERLTDFGRWLRASSLDELPELVNVFRGDMSLVGPRPLLPEYDALYDSRQRRRLELRPGLTGLAQVQGRNALSWEARFEFDVEYVEQRSWRLDLWILWRTVAVVLRRDGIAAAEHATMPPFRGSATPPTEAERRVS